MFQKSIIQPVRRQNEGVPLSWFQERLWLLNQKNPGDTSYNIPVAFLIEGNLDVAALGRSLDTIIRRHENLRTRFIATSHGAPTQMASPPEHQALPIVDATDDEVRRHVSENAEHRFDLAQGPVVIARLLRLGPARHVLLMNVHHIVADGWSIEGILFSELQKCYQAFCEGQQPDLPELPIQYADFAAWQRKQDISDHLAYWRESLHDYEDTLELPTDFLRQVDSGQRSATFKRYYPRDFAFELDRFAQRHNCTLFMGLLASYALLAARYTGKNDVCIGTTTSGRPLPELEGLIGFFINILPIRVRIDDNWSVAQLMAEVRKLTLAAFDHQAVPFEKILQSLGATGKGGALVPLVVRHQNFPHTRMDKDMPGGVRFSPYPTAAVEDGEPAPAKGALARCEIELSYTGNRDRLELEVVYAADLYQKATIDRLLSHQQGLLREMFEGGNRRVGELSMLGPEDVHRLCVEHNRTLRGSTEKRNFVERFDTQAERTPDAVACHDRTGATHYHALASLTNRLAHALGARGAGHGNVIGVCLERSAQLLASFLAVWKTGAAYVPLDPAYPDSYLRQIIDSAAPKLVIGTTATLAKLGLPPAQGFALDAEMDALSRFSDAPPPVTVDADTLAYIMYTSGSTGVPKGVRVPHRQLINWQGGLEANWPFEPGEMVAQKTTIAFAPSVKELFAGLLCGVPQVMIEGTVVQDTAAFVATLARHNVTRVNLVPSHLQAILTYLEKQQLTLPALRLCVVAGEPLTAEIVTSFRVLLPHARLLNNYGCTELNDMTYYDASDFDGSAGFVPVGRPIQNTRLYVLDAAKRLVPEGVAGEMHIASLGIPQGYHDLPELDAVQFIADPFSDTPGARLFNTGDVVRRLADGNLEYIGRRDFQVKVRGQRVDVRHVEKVLGEFPGIGMRAVVGEGNQLFAYYVTAEGQTVDLAELRRFLHSRLPPFMVPGALVCLTAMPRLPNGKLNRRALRPSLGQLQQSSTYEAPATEIERTLAEIWSEVLEISNEEIGRQSHFFEIGGHSLSAARVVAHIKEKLGVEVGMSQVFEYPRLTELAERVDKARSDGGSVTEEAAAEAGPRPREATAARSFGLLQDKVVLISGASRGIGSATARLLARHGAKVAINYLHNEARARRVKELIDADGGTADLFQADVTDKDQVDSLVAAVKRTYGRVDVLVSNAAIGFKMQSFVNHGWDDFARKINDELKTIFYLCKAVVPDMIEAKSGSIIAVSSSMARTWGPGFLSHSTAKAALDALVRALACELGPEGIRVNIVAPGLILTDATANLPPQTKESAAARSPLRRNGLPRDVAGAVLFLASDLSQYMTGGYLPVDGGFTMP